MKIATYNINGVNGRLPVLLRWLNESQPDVACLQELKCPNEKFPEKAILDAGYTAIWHGQKSWNGVAILAKSKYNLVEVGKELPGDPEDVQSRFIQAAINGILFVCLYLPNGNPAPGPKFDYKIAWYNRFLLKAQELIELNVPVILAGDYNTISTELDAKKPESWLDNALFFPEPRAAYQRLLSQGWIDSIRVLNPDQKVFTFWDYFRNAFSRDAGIRIDHLLLSPNLEKRLVKGAVDREVRGWEKSSDHAPVWIEISE
jgi:exodeoxyribonuclease-3